MRGHRNNAAAVMACLAMMALILCVQGAQRIRPTAPVQVDSSPNQGRFCCDIPNGDLIWGNSRLVFATPVQVQISCAGDACFTSGINAVPADAPVYALGVPFPDFEGGQTTFSLQQAVASFAEMGNTRGRQDVAFWHMQTNPDSPLFSQAASLQAYLNFTYAYGGPPPALAWTAHPALETLFSPFTVSVDAKAIYRNGYLGAVNCAPEFNLVNVPGVPTSVYYSQAVAAGRTIYSSLLTSDNLGASVGAQTTRILQFFQTILGSGFGQTMESIIDVNIYLSDIADQPAVDAAYKAFFGNPATGMPIRTVFGKTRFILPHQAGAKVGMRFLALRRYPYCSAAQNAIDRYNVPEVFHEPPTLSSIASAAAGWVYFGGVYSSNFSYSSGEAVEFQQKAYDAIKNVLWVGAERGVALADVAYIWTWYQNVLLGYNGIADATAQFMNSTEWLAWPATFEPNGQNPYNFQYQLEGQFWYGVDGGQNYQAFPSAFPWINEGDNLCKFFNITPCTIPNNYFCTNSSLRTCAKPGFIFNNYPYQPTNSLGPQQAAGSNTVHFAVPEHHEGDLSPSDVRTDGKTIYMAPENWLKWLKKNRPEALEKLQ